MLKQNISIHLKVVLLPLDTNLMIILKQLFLKVRMPAGISKA